MRYALLIYEPPGLDGIGEAEAASITREYMEIREDGRVRGGERLSPPSNTTTVRVEDAQALTTDGPFADTKEVLGGFFLIEAADLDEAIELTSRIPATRMGGAVEIRPIVEMPA